MNNFMDRVSYFEKINSIISPLSLLPDCLNEILQIRTNDLTEPTDKYTWFADKLRQLNSDAAKTRAEFIDLQCNQKDTTIFFEKYRESWGIPKFEENLLTSSDFKNGFLFTFRDHTTSWRQDAEARRWFYTHIECRFIRHWQFWSCDKGYDEKIYQESGNYKTILKKLFIQYNEFEILISPAFIKAELKQLLEEHNDKLNHFSEEDIEDFLIQNPNW